MEIRHLRLPVELRSELAEPLGELIEGTAQQVGPVLAKRLAQSSGLVVTVGDVVSSMLLVNGVQPQLMITDGMTKRAELEQKVEDTRYEEIITTSPAAEVSEEAWGTIRYIVEGLTPQSRIHLIVDGEEDLLVLPVIVELGDRDYSVIYGQPNKGAVVLTRNLSKRFLIESIIDRMETVSDEHRDT